MKRYLIVLLLACLSAPGGARADGFFSNYTFIPSISLGGFLLYGPREEEDNFLDEDGFWGAEQGGFYELGFTAFSNVGIWTDGRDSFSPDIFPYVTSSHGDTLDFDEIGLRLGVSGTTGGGSGKRGFWSIGIKVGEIDVDASSQTTTDSDVRVFIPGQKERSHELYAEVYGEIDNGLGWQLAASFKQFFLDGVRKADDTDIDDMEIEIITLRFGLNYML